MIKNKMSVKKDKKIKIKSKIKKFDYKKVYNLITKRFHIKLLCLSMAFILFLYVRYQQEFSKDYIAKLQILNVPSKLLIANNINENIQVLLQNASKLSASGMKVTEMPSTTVRMAIAVVGILPIIIVYPMFQKYFVKGITLGGVKE